MGDAAVARATYQDVIDAPEHQVAEVLGGVLYTHPRPAIPHALAVSVLGGELSWAFHRGRGGPGGWILLFEPELHLGGDVLVPDLAGWRRERLPHLPKAPFLEVAPDFACEVLSQSTVRVDRELKMPIYARERVAHVWLVHPIERTVEVYRLDGESYRLVVTRGGDQVVRLEPFDAIELELSAMWPQPEGDDGS